MERYEMRQIVKSELKKTAKRLHELKGCRKLGKRQGRKLWDIVEEINSLKYEFRHKHIAYCMFFNYKHLGQIESTKSERYEKPSLNRIGIILQGFEQEVDRETKCEEALCHCA